MRLCCVVRCVGSQVVSRLFNEQRNFVRGIICAACTVADHQYSDAGEPRGQGACLLDSKLPCLCLVHWFRVTPFCLCPISRLCLSDSRLTVGKSCLASLLLDAGLLLPQRPWRQAQQAHWLQPVRQRPDGLPNRPCRPGRHPGECTFSKFNAVDQLAAMSTCCCTYHRRSSHSVPSAIQIITCSHSAFARGPGCC